MMLYIGKESSGKTITNSGGHRRGEQEGVEVGTLGYAFTKLHSSG